MSELKIFNYQGSEIRTTQRDGEIWWVLKDVCEILEIGNSRMTSDRLDADEKGVSIIDTLGGKQEMTTISEAGLYNVILLSRKPEAKSFKRWVTHEVLPSIRKHGAYATPQTLEAMLNDPDTMIMTLQALKSEREERQRLSDKVEADAPKVLFADSVVASNTDILVGELAKLLRQNGVDVGQNRLFEILRKEGYLITRSGTDWNMPTQKSVDMGLMRIKESTRIHADGHTSIDKTPKVTGKGQVYFINRYRAKDALSA